MSERDPASEQLQNYKKKNVKSMPLINNNGCPIDDRMHTLTVGPRGPILLEDTLFLDEITHFDRERIPERVVHAKGAGAFGEFEVTHDIRKYCRANLFSRLGKKTPIAVRFSTVGGENGSADTVRDPRGFAIKFYTEEGNWDLVGNNTPVFFIRDPILFPSLVHSQKRNPVTHLRDPDMFWDFITLRPETTHQVLLLFADRGIPDGYRFMNGYSSHAYKLVNEKSEIFYCKFHYKTTQGVRNLMPNRARELAATDPDYAIRDLYNAIENVDLPSWTLYIQVMTVQQAGRNKFNPFDLTKIWPHNEYPLIPVGKFLLNKNPRNYFAEVEQLAFSPAHLVPGIEPSPDKMLLGRLFSYGDAHRYRLGSNYLQIPVNCPYRSTTANYQRDGLGLHSNQGEAPNYFPNSFNGPVEERRFKPHAFHCSGDVARYGGGDEDNYSQAADFWNKVLLLEEKDRLVVNVSEHLKHAHESLQERAVKMFTNVSPDLGQQIAEKLKLRKMDSKF